MLISFWLCLFVMKLYSRNDIFKSIVFSFCLLCRPRFLNCICATLVLAWHADKFAKKIGEVRIIKEWKVYTFETLSKYPWKHP